VRFAPIRKLQTAEFRMMDDVAHIGPHSFDIKRNFYDILILGIAAPTPSGGHGPQSSQHFGRRHC
ncbi:MAG TPA: hypothetical protein PK677_13770, partial [Acidiphilium sp.]|nr:hypothetical protein [Acidiphilium sp.]